MWSKLRRDQIYPSDISDPNDQSDQTWLKWPKLTDGLKLLKWQIDTKLTPGLTVQRHAICQKLYMEKSLRLEILLPQIYVGSGKTNSSENIFTEGKGAFYLTGAMHDGFNSYGYFSWFVGFCLVVEYLRGSASNGATLSSYPMFPQSPMFNNVSFLPPVSPPPFLFIGPKKFIPKGI